MASSLSKIAISTASIVILSQMKELRKRRRRTTWVNSFLKGRNYTQPLDDLGAYETELFRNFCRMSLSDFNILLGKIDEKVSRKDINYRESIPASVRLAQTLRFLATGDSHGSLNYLFRISKPSISKIIPEVCEAIVHALKDYVKMPEN
ncbi:uncharacterized protein LOC123320400 [Coccinella septempunctata]|uniref:uncharacterized protein LOC123320400 n=1 Tax=Coccinella septempunctata TaxID=41139 RepID=UPI001D07F630|nr:uncharacterized protein LOC123320400 [Coccinella septempunctata]